MKKGTMLIGRSVKFHGAKHEVKKFPSWEEYLKILSWPKNRPLTLVEKKMQTVGLIFKIFFYLLYLNEIYLKDVFACLLQM